MNEVLIPLIINCLLQTYWYAVLLMGIGFVITMALFIRCFAAHTPSRFVKLSVEYLGIYF